MQEETSDAILHSDKDVVVLAPTGSGKTLAYLLPIASRLNAGSDEVQAVVIVPGRELALQSHEVFQSMGSGLRSACLYGGRATMDEHRLIMRTKPQIVFATPGRLNDHIDKLNINADSVRWLVLDEFDKCLRMGFRAEMQKALESLPNIERRILLSATDSDEMPSFVRMQRTININHLTDEEQTPDRIGLYTVQCPERDKLGTLDTLLRSFGNQQTIVFMNYRDGVERVSQYLRNEGYVHYNLPVGEDEYIHRVGRTGRWDATGRAFMLIGPEEHLPEYVKEKTEEYKLDDNSKKRVPLPRMATIYIGKGKKDKISKGDILGYLCKTCGVEGSEIGRIDVYERYAYVAVERKTADRIVKISKGAKIKGVRTIIEKAF